MKFDHIGIVVKSIEEARAIFESDLPGFSPSKIYIDKEIDVKIQFIEYQHSIVGYQYSAIEHDSIIDNDAR